MEKQTKNFMGELLGEPTAAKASGTLYTLIAIVPVLVVLVFSVLLGALGVLGVLTKETTEQTWYLYVNVLLMQLSFALVAFAYFKWTKQPVQKTIGLEKCPWKYFLLALATASLSISVPTFPGFKVIICLHSSFVSSAIGLSGKSLI